MDNDHANVNAQGALQVLETLRIRAEAKEVDHYESERPAETIDEMADSDMRTAVGNASELEVSTTLTEGEDEDESSDGRQLGVVTRGGNTGIEFVYDLENDDPSNPSSDIEYSSTPSGHQRGAISRTFGPFRHADDHPTNHARQLQAEPSAKPPMRVRFRSRVRITSGLRRQHSRTLSYDSSPSSSISAPLRYSQGESDSPHSEINARRNSLYGDFAKRKACAYVRPPRDDLRPMQGTKPSRIRGENSAEEHPHGAPLDERTALSSSAGWRRGYISSLMRDDLDDSSDEDGPLDDDGGFTRAILRRRIQSNTKDTPNRRSEEDVLYGGLPWRLFNRRVRMS